MWRCPAGVEGAGFIRAGLPVADGFVGVLSVDIEEVGIDCLCVVAAEGADDMGDGVLMCIGVVGIEETDDLAGSDAQALVHCVIDTVVRLGDECSQPGTMLPEDVESSIGRTAIDDNVFDIWIVLAEDAGKGPADSLCIVEADGNYGNFHRLVSVRCFCRGRNDAGLGRGVGCVTRFCLFHIRIR